MRRPLLLWMLKTISIRDKRRIIIKKHASYAHNPSLSVHAVALIHTFCYKLGLWA
jgi:hypothetical protein